MKRTDIRVRSVTVSFTEERFRTPLRLSTGSISTITYAKVQVEVENRQGRVAQGYGGTLLSDLWAFPSTKVPHVARDRAMRALTQRLGELAYELKMWGDPFEIAHEIETQLPSVLAAVTTEHGLVEPLPYLAGLVCGSPLDAALHDAWGQAAGMNTYFMYHEDCMNGDLSRYLGPEFAGRFPGDYLREPLASMPIQHVVGGGDKLLRTEEDSSDPADGLPNSLEGWIERDRVHWFKLKLSGRDLKGDLQRLIDVHQIAEQTARRLGIEEPVQLQGDPNEACESPTYLVELLRRLHATSPDAYAALQYFEQPTPRRLADYTYTLHQVSALKPVIIDESLDDLRNLERLLVQGWSGMALKTCKGQSHTLLAYCWAKQHDLFVTIQDLTNPGLAFRHAAHLARRLWLSVPCVEYNSRQYAPWSCLDERKGYEDLFTVVNGKIHFPAEIGVGLY